MWYRSARRSERKICWFPANFRNTNLCRTHVGPLIREYAKNKWFLSQSRRMFFSSFDLINGTKVTPLLLFHLELGLICMIIYCFVENTPVKCFNNFVECAVSSRCQGDENANCCAFAKTMNLLTNSSYGYQIMNCSRHSITKYTND